MRLSPARLRSLVDRTWARARAERGSTMVPAMGMLSVAMLLTLGAYSAVGGDLPLARGDQDRKQAYAAAEAGIAYYLFHLDQDNTYWTKCTNVPAPSASEQNPVNQAWDGTGTDPRRWRNITGSSAQYTLELIPAPTYSQCIEGDQDSMLNPVNGTFRIRSTGRSNGVKRSIVATFKRKSFLDYLYFTDFETLDPIAYEEDQQDDASANCVKYWYAGRNNENCTEIRFVTGDEVEGPLHTNDSMLVCGTPVFGRTAADSIEVSAPPQGWRSDCSGSNPSFVGTWKPGSQLLTLPLSNSALATLALPAYRFTGKTTIRLAGSSMTVTTGSPSTTQTLPFPSNGVVYVQNGSCGTSYRRAADYADPTGCANVYVSGTYSQDLTIASANDIIIRPPTGSTNGDVIASGSAMLGLIPNNLVRVYHPVDDCDNDTGSMQNVRIEASILALNHSFIVDNWYCGNKLGTLTVKGAIAQRFRGPVGTGGSSGSGYLKDYQYDDRLRSREPPHFLDPVQTAWTIRRFAEQVPAR